MTLLSGTRLGAYQVVRPLGAGGMGEVYRARDEKLGRDVAIKVLPAEHASEPDRLERFHREARAVAALSHPNILAIFEVGEAGEVSYAVTELLEGETLRERLERERLSPRKAAEIALPIAQGLAAAHERGIVHRDLKPDNIFLTRDGVVKILDFGLARHDTSSGPEERSAPTLARHTDAGTVLGTAGYMSPEQVRGAVVDGRSDIFSFGVVLYEMLAGRRAFQRDAAAETMAAILRDEPPEITTLVSDLPPALERIMQHCLEKKPEDRFQSSKDLAFGLQSVTRGQTSSGSAQRAVAVVPRRPWRLAAVAFALLAGGLAAGFLLGRRSARPSDAVPSHPLLFQQLTDQSGVESQPSLAPDGKSFVHVSSSRGNADIHLQRVGGRNPVNLTAASDADDLTPAFSPDGEKIAFRSEREGGGIFVMDATGESVRRLTDFGYNPAWSPDGSEIVVSSTSFISPTVVGSPYASLEVVEVKTGKVRRIAEGVSAFQPSWSPHGTRIACWGLGRKSAQRDIRTFRADGSELKSGGVDVMADQPLDWSPVWSPDGRFLYFESNRSGSMNLWRVAIDEESGRALAAPEAVTLPANWSGALSLSRDGRRIAFETLDWRSTLVKVAFDARAEKIVGPPIPILRSTQPMRDHEVSPDGQWITFSQMGSQEDLCVARLDGSEYRRLTDDPFRDRGAAWSPDGRRIAFYSDRSGNGTEVWTIHPDGSGLEQLSDMDGGAGAPLWSPDGARMVVSSIRKGTLLFETTLGTKIRGKALPRISEAESLWAQGWSPDGKTIVGQGLRRDASWGGLVLYSPASGRYELLGGTGFRYARWLGDSRRLIVRDDRSISLMDTLTRKSHLLLAVGGLTLEKGLGFTKDEKWITFSETAAEGDIWLATLP